MSKNKPTKKKVVVPTKRTTEKTTPKPTVSRSRTTAGAGTPQEALLFGRQNYIFMGVGIALIFLGLLLMSGGHMPSDEVWDDDLIYSFRRTVLAPVVILAGLGVEIYAIFKR